MRSVAFTGAFVVFAYAATAQLSLLPQVGFENSGTSLRINDLSSFRSTGINFSPQASLRLDYKFKQGHGPWLGISSSRTRLDYYFDNPETADIAYTAQVGNMQLRIEGGYQHSFKPIYFNKNASGKSKTSAAKTAPAKNESEYKTYTIRKMCNGKEVTIVKRCVVQKEVPSTRCGDKKLPSKAEAVKGTWVRIQPQLGAAYLPGKSSPIVRNTNNGQLQYLYEANSVNTALLGGMGFEFGRNKSKLFTVTVNYIHGLDNNSETLTVQNGNKTTITNFKSRATGWSMKVGIPFGLEKKKSSKDKKDCKSYKPQCNSLKYNQKVKL